LAIADVGGARRVGCEPARLDGAAGLAVVLVASGVVLVSTLVPALSILLTAPLIAALVASTTRATRTARLKAAALFARLVLGTDTGADADGLPALGESGTASRGAIGGSEALAANELDASSVSDVLLAGGVRDALAGGEIRGGVDGRDDDWRRLVMETARKEQEGLTGESPDEGEELDHDGGCGRTRRGLAGGR
jgi:hypothetical protein